MNKKEIDLLCYFLELASDEFGSHICNDVDEEVWDNWSLKERKRFVIKKIFRNIKTNIKNSSNNLRRGFSSLTRVFRKITGSFRSSEDSLKNKNIDYLKKRSIYAIKKKKLKRVSPK